MAKVKPLKDEEYDVQEDVQCTLYNHTSRLEQIRKCIQTVMDNQTANNTNGSKPVRIDEQQCHSILEKAGREIITRYLNEAGSQSKNGTDQSLSKFLETMTGQHNVLFSQLNFLKDFAKYSIGKYDEVLEASHNISQALAAPDHTEVESDTRPKNIKKWVPWIYRRFIRWVDIHIGWCYIRRFLSLVLFFFWSITVATSFFILRENHRLNETEKNYHLLRRECMKHKHMQQVVHAVESVFFYKESE